MARRDRFLTSVGAIDHGSIAGLSDDDHTQYLLVDGTRALTDNLLFSDATAAIIDLTTDSATLTLRGRTSASANANLATFDPDGLAVLHYAGITAFRTNDGSASDKLSYADVKDFDGTFRDVGFAIHTLTDFNTNITLSQTHFTGKALRDTETTTPRTLTLANDSAIPFGAEVEIWNGQTGASGTNLTIAQGTGVTLRWYGGSGTISTGNRTLAIAGYCKIRKYNDTIYWITGVGIT